MKKYLTFPILIRFGLACVFLTNSLTAFFDPSEFLELLSNSFVLHIVPVTAAAFVTFIGFNDMIVAILLVLGWRTSLVAKYATAWLLGVISVIGIVSLDALEHLSFLSMAVALAVSRRSE